MSPPATDMSESDEEENLVRALADLELLEAAYPDEISTKEDSIFPLRFSFRLPDSSSVINLELPSGYPLLNAVRITSFHATTSGGKARLEAAVAAMKKAALEALELEEEGGLACCAAGFEAWHDYTEETSVLQAEQVSPPIFKKAVKIHKWITGAPLVDRKSSFIAHVCSVSKEHDVHEALDQLIHDNPKLTRASHNMWAYRFTESLENGDFVLKHDNDDDGEDAAGSRLAHLLHVRNEDGAFVVVSRFYGGTKLGPKRFAHITNVASEILESFRER